ncbi:unnamed protein product, partial [Iphiclides podalirius]
MLCAARYCFRGLLMFGEALADAVEGRLGGGRLLEGGVNRLGSFVKLEVPGVEFRAQRGRQFLRVVAVTLLLFRELIGLELALLLGFTVLVNRSRCVVESGLVAAILRSMISPSASACRQT